jgi:ferrochelatase
MLNKLKSRWGIHSTFQLILILLAFSLTGSASLIVKNWIFSLININSETSLWLKIPLYIIIIIPAYNALLILIGSLLGQFQFFYAFQKKSWSRLKRKKLSD